MAELTPLARPYAKAVFDLAIERGETDQWSSLLCTLAEVCEDETIRSALANPAIEQTVKSSWFSDAIGTDCSGSFLQFIQLLACNGRLLLLPTIAGMFQSHLNEKNQSEEVDVYSSYPLNNEQLNDIQGKLERKLNKKVTLVQHQDSSLIGGVRIQGKGWIMDASIEGRLKALARNLTV